MDIMVEGPRSAQVAGMLHERDIPYAIAIGDVDPMIRREQGSSFTKDSRTSALRRKMDWKGYYRLDVIYSFMDDLATRFPYLCTVSVIGRSVEGRDLKMLKISNGNSGNEGVWIDGSIHPREWISTAVVTYLANYLVTNYHELSETVTNKDWYILPVLNPDGYEYTHTHDRMWRKNRARYGECVGVDLNRNFSYGWGEKGEEGSSEDPGNIFFRGPEPFSEPETAAVKHVILESGTNFKVFLSLHSYGEVIIFPWGYTGDPCPDYVELLEGGTAMAKYGRHTSTGRLSEVIKDLLRVLTPWSVHSGDAGLFFELDAVEPASSSLSGLELESSCGAGGLSHQSYPPYNCEYSQAGGVGRRGELRNSCAAKALWKRLDGAGSG
ncbi:jg14029 [Pararge aegeria aegeria]|uniref:Jg14029 protein n=1 Tax=Pararge aegeria aegeria TaxID=348720 RepID=A0A8S4R6W1_9NEOP|nr:jg14029 [Pararge aegeria aegeria]